MIMTLFCYLDIELPQSYKSNCYNKKALQTTAADLPQVPPFTSNWSLSLNAFLLAEVTSGMRLSWGENHFMWESHLDVSDRVLFSQQFSLMFSFAVTIRCHYCHLTFVSSPSFREYKKMCTISLLVREILLRKRVSSPRSPGLMSLGDGWWWC